MFKKLYELQYDSYVTIEREIEGEQQIGDIRRQKNIPSAKGLLRLIGGRCHLS